jgi:mercuric ion transport protein
VALVANAAAWFRHRQWWRTLLGIAGPAMVLAAMLVLFGQWWTARLLYTGLTFMIGGSLWDLLSPGGRSCECTADARAPR